MTGSDFIESYKDKLRTDFYRVSRNRNAPIGIRIDMKDVALVLNQ